MQNKQRKAIHAKLKYNIGLNQHIHEKTQEGTKDRKLVLQTLKEFDRGHGMTNTQVRGLTPKVGERTYAELRVLEAQGLLKNKNGFYSIRG